MLAASPAQAATSLREAEEKALEALGVEQSDRPVIVFRQRRALKPDTVVRQAAGAKPPGGRASRRGVRVGRSPAVLRSHTRQRAWLFYSDDAPFQAYQHPGRVALIGKGTGKVKLSDRLAWPPVVGGKLPRFMRSAAAYRNPRNRVFYRPWAVQPAAASRASGAEPRPLAEDRFGAGVAAVDLGLYQRAADRLGAERSCVVRAGETLGGFYDFAALEDTVVGFGGVFNELERLSDGFSSRRYNRRSGLSPLDFVEREIERGCADVLVYLVGSGYRGRSAVNVGLRPRRDGTVLSQDVSARELRRFVRARPGTTFKLLLDAPHSLRFARRLGGAPNVLIVQAAGDAAFRYLPEAVAGDQELDNDGNPLGLLEFSNRIAIGVRRFLDSRSEIEHAADEQDAGRSRSFLAWMLGRAFSVTDGGASPGLAQQTGAVEPVSETPPDSNPTTPPDGGAQPPPDPPDDGGDGTPPDGGGDDGMPPGGGGTDSPPGPVNDAPVLTTTGGTTAYTEGDPATTIDAALTASDVDDTQLEGGQVRISAGFRAGEALLFSDQSGITGTYNSATGVLTLAGAASVSDYQTALRSVEFRTPSDDPGTSRTIEFKVNDGDADSNLATRGIAITPVDDPPVAVDDSATVVEDAAAAAVDVLANDTDVDGGAKTIQSASDPANGTVVVTGGGTGLTYGPDPNYCNDPPGTTTDTFTYTLNGGSTATVSVTVTCVDDPPVAVDDSATVVEDAAAAAVDVLANDTDVDGGAMTISSASDPADGSVVLTGGSAGAHTGLTYEPDPDYCNDPPGTAPDTFTYTLNGGSTATVSVTVTCVNDPPVGVDDSATVLEDAAASAVDVLANDTDVDGGAMTISSASDPANGTVVLTGGAPGAHTGLTYQPDPNYCNDPPGTAPDTFTYTLNGGDTATVSMTVTCVNDAPVADDETFNGNDSAHGNTTMQVDDPDDDKPAPTNPHTEIAGDILAGDSDVDGPGPLTVTPGTFATNDGGSVTLETDGDFVFQPAASTSCTDTSDFFDYTVEDSGSPELTDTGRVTIAIAGCVWYVSNNAAGNSGTSVAPFDTLAQAETASGANHTVFVFDGDNTTTGYTTGYAMDSGERLIGEHEGLTVDPDQGSPLTADTLHPANAGARPTLTASNEDVIELDDGNEVRGFVLDPAGTGGGIAGASGDTGGGTIDDINIVDGGTAGTQPGLELDATTGTFDISHLTVSTNGVTGIRLNNAGTANFASAGTVSVTTTGAKGLDATNTNMGAGSVFDDITVTGSGAGGVSMSGTTGTTTLGDGTGTDLSLTTTSGATPAFNLANAGTVTVPSAGTANLSATGGPAADVTGTSGASLSFDTVSSASSANDGINIAGLGSGSFSATGGSIGGNAGIAVDIDGGSGNVTYPGAINDGTGLSLDMTNRTGGTVLLSGTITDSADTGGGINATGNGGGAGGTLRISGSNNVIDAGNQTAVNVQNTTIGTGGLNFRSLSSNGAVSGIVLNNTGSTAGLTVTGSGTASSGGTIQNSTGPGLLLTNTANLGLARMSVTGGGDDGISGTGVAGFDVSNSSLTNNGNAANEEGISLVNVTGVVSLANTSVTGSGYNNLRIDNTSGTISSLSISGGSYSNNSQTTGNHGILMEIRGTSTLTSGTISGATISDNFSIGVQAVAGDTATVSNLTITGNTFTGTRTGATSGSQEIAVDCSKSQTSNMTCKITDNLGILNHNSHAINVATAAGAGTGGVFNARITGNTIGTAGTAFSGSNIGNGIRVNLNGDSSNRVLVSNNTVRQFPNGRGIEAIGRNGTGGSDVTVTNNILDGDFQSTAQNGGAELASIVVQSNCVTVCNTVRSDVRDNTVPAATNVVDFSNTHIILLESSTSTLNLVDTTSPISGTCAGELAATNTGSTSVVGACSLITGPINTPP